MYPFDKKNYRVVSISDSNGTRTHNHLVCKRTLNHLVKLVKGLSWPKDCVVNTYLRGAPECMFLSCHVRVFGVDPQAIVAWMWNLKILLKTGAISEILSDCKGIRMPSTGKYSWQSSTIWPIWLHCWVFV